MTESEFIRLIRRSSTEEIIQKIEGLSSSEIQSLSDIELHELIDANQNVEHNIRRSFIMGLEKLFGSGTEEMLDYTKFLFSKIHQERLIERASSNEQLVELIERTKVKKLPDLFDKDAQIKDEFEKRAKDNPVQFIEKLAQHPDFNGFTMHEHYLDTLLGFPGISEIENLNEFLPPDGISYVPTHFDDAYKFLKELNLQEDDIFYDLGSGPNRIPIMAKLFTNVGKAIGIEVQQNLVEIGNRVAEKHGLKNVELIHSNVLDHDFTDGTVFYMYFPFTGATEQEVLRRLKEDVDHEIKIVATGTTVAELDSLCEDGWLERMRFKTLDPRHIGYYSNKPGLEKRKREKLK